MTRVALLNNYSMRSALARVEAGEYPAQHLYGFPVGSGERAGLRWELPARSIYDVGWMRRGPGRLLRTAIVRLVGDPLQQRAARGADVVFAADQWSARGLLILKRLGLGRRRIVVLVHHPPRTAVERGILAAADRLAFLGPQARAAFGEAQRDAPLLPWGPDPGAGVYRDARSPVPPELDFVAAGKTNRDYAGLRAAAERHALSGVLYEADGVTVYTRGVAAHRPGAGALPAILADIARARAVVVPLRDPGVMSGLTEIADAIALDRPVVVTRSAALPYDVAGARAGVVIEDNSPESIRSALERLSADPSLGAGRLSGTYGMAAYAAALDGILASLTSIDS